MPTQAPAAAAPKRKSLFAQRQKATDSDQPSNMPTAPIPDKVNVSVFRDILERETSDVAVQPPKPRVGAFPEATHRDGMPEFQSRQQSMPLDPFAAGFTSAKGPSAVGDSRVDPHSASFQRMKAEIEEENQKSLAKMTKYEINQAQQEILSQLNPKLLGLLQQRLAKKTGVSQVPSFPATEGNGPSLGSLVAPRSGDLTADTRPAATVGRSAPPPIRKASDKKTTMVEQFSEEDIKQAEARMAKYQGSEQSRVNPTEAALENLKQQWMNPVTEEEKKQVTSKPRSTLEAEAYRFDFDGNLLVFPHTKEGLIELTELGRKYENHSTSNPAKSQFFLTQLSRCFKISKRCSP